VSCYWKGCGRKGEIKGAKDDIDMDKEGTKEKDPKGVERHPFSFPNMEAFKKHVEKKHLAAYAWYLGDGVRGSDLDGNESDNSFYLKDASGNQITPSIADQEIVRRHDRKEPKKSAVNKPLKRGAALLSSGSVRREMGSGTTPLSPARRGREILVAVTVPTVSPGRMEFE